MGVIACRFYIFRSFLSGPVKGSAYTQVYTVHVIINFALYDWLWPTISSLALPGPSEMIQLWICRITYENVLIALTYCQITIITELIFHDESQVSNQPLYSCLTRYISLKYFLGRNHFKSGFRTPEPINNSRLGLKHTTFLNTSFILIRLMMIHVVQCV